jgi:hypothetical protein
MAGPPIALDSWHIIPRWERPSCCGYAVGPARRGRLGKTAWRREAIECQRRGRWFAMWTG